MGWTDAGVLLERSTAPVRGEMESWVGLLLQHLTKILDGRGKRREAVVQFDEHRAGTEVVEEGVANRTMVSRLRDCLKAWTRMVQEN